jgi:SLT domain-containing protein
MQAQGSTLNSRGMARLQEIINLEASNLGSKTNEGSLSQLTKAQVPAITTLYQNHPNPFNPITHIRYQLTHDSKVILKVYDVLGRDLKTLVNEIQSAGFKVVTFDGSTLPSGIYFYRIQAGSFTDVKKMALMK